MFNVICSECSAKENKIEELEELITSLREDIQSYEYEIDDLKDDHAREISIIRAEYDADNFVILDLSLDPDPYGLHGLSLNHRLEVMKHETD